MGNPFVHIELNTDDVAAAKKFYKKVFDWKLEDMSMGPGKTYTMVNVGKGTGGGMMQKPMPHAPTMWLSYVEVADVKKTLAKAKKAGGHILVDYMHIGMGELGVFSDPHGGTVGVWKSVQQAPPVKKAAKKADKKGGKKADKKADKKAAKAGGSAKKAGKAKAPGKAKASGKAKKKKA